MQSSLFFFIENFKLFAFLGIGISKRQLLYASGAALWHKMYPTAASGSSGCVQRGGECGARLATRGSWRSAVPGAAAVRRRGAVRLLRPPAARRSARLRRTTPPRRPTCQRQSLGRAATHSPTGPAARARSPNAPREARRSLLRLPSYGGMFMLGMILD